MYKYLKFLNDHPSGSFHKGDVVRIPKASEKAWLDSGHVEKSTEKTYDKFIADKLETREKESKEARKAHFDKHDKIAEQNQKKKDAATKKEDEEQQALIDAENEKHYHIINDNDLKKFPKLTDGFEVGDEVLVNKERGFLTDEDGLLVKKVDEKYHTLSDEDLTDEPILTDGFKSGDEIEMNDEGVWLLGEDEKLIKKGNV